MREDESRTWLNATKQVHKSDVRIALYGELDNMQAEVICAQTALPADGELYASLQEVLNLLRDMMRALVKDEPLKPWQLFGHSPDELREISHYVQRYFGIAHITPDASMGATLASLNRLRTCARSLERAAACCFMKNERPDVLSAVNRLSSALYILMCRHMAKRTAKA